jgi:hypothetical protein
MRIGIRKLGVQLLFDANDGSRLDIAPEQRVHDIGMMLDNMPNSTVGSIGARRGREYHDASLVAALALSQARDHSGRKRPMRANARAILIKALRDAHCWLHELLSDPRRTLESLASREGKTERSIRTTRRSVSSRRISSRRQSKDACREVSVSNVSLIFRWRRRINGARSGCRRQHEHRSASRSLSCYVASA